MKRPVVIVAVVYAAGLAAGSLLRLPPLVVLGGIAAIAVSQIIVLARGRRASDLLLLAAVFLIGDYRQNRIEAQDRAARERLAILESREHVRLEGRLVSMDRVYPGRRTFRLDDCVVRRGDEPPIRFPTAIQLVCSGPAAEAMATRPPVPGDRVVATGRLERPPDLSNPDVFNYRAHLERDGVGASLFVRGPGAVSVSPPRGWRSPVEIARAAGERLCRPIERMFDRALDPQSAALARSIFLGQAHLLDRDLRRDFTRCGLAHIFAVSGLNVAILVWVWGTFIQVFGLRPLWRSVLLIFALAVFCAIVGFCPSVVRAAIMFGMVLAGPILQNKVEPLTALAAAALAILFVDPRALWQASFQLSFLCMLSIILLKPPLDAWLRLDDEKGTPRRRRIAGLLNRHGFSLVTVVLAAQIGLIPFLAHYCHRIPVVGVLSNIVVAPIVWAIVAIGVILLGVGAVVPPAAWVFGGGTLNLLSHVLTWVLKWWSDFPAVSIVMPSWPLFAGAAYYLFLFGWAVLPHEPSPFFEARQRARLWLALAAIVAWVVWAPALLRGGATDLRATFLDVGQGDSCVLELPGGPVVVIDGGPGRAGEYVVAPYLESRGIDHVDAVVATHPDADHIGGFPSVFGQLDVAWLLEGPGRSESQIYARLLESATAEPARRDTLYAGDWIEAPMGARLLVLHPPRGVVYSSRNDQSLVLLVDWGECEILLTGDAEQRAERDLLASGCDVACDVLKVSHHGSANGTSPALLDGARPMLAILSCGRDNPFGHPDPAVIDRLRSAGVTIARTDQDGAVVVRFHGREMLWGCTGKD